MRVGTNILSLSAQRSLAQTTKALARSMERLASGKRINSSRDDAAGLAISLRLHTEIQAMAQASRNANDAVGLLNVADGALSVQSEIVQRMRELALQAANGTLSSNDRSYLDREFQELRNEFDRISTQSEFRGQKIFDGHYEAFRVQVGSRKSDQIQMGISLVELADLETAETEGTGSFTETIIDPPGSFVRGTAAGDFDGDGDEDLAVTTYNDGYIGLYLNDGNGAFSLVSTKSTASAAGTVETADLNGDSVLDIVVGASFAGQSSVYLGNGDGTFQNRITFDSYGYMAEIDLVDLNHDDLLDIVAANGLGGTSEMAVFLNQGSGVFSSRVTYLAGGFTIGAAVADFNEDGNSDIVFGHNGGVGASVYFGNGDGTFQSYQTFSGALIPGVNYSTTSEDYNEDGHDDLLMVKSGGTHFGIWFGNGDGTFISPADLAPFASGRYAGEDSVDFDNDGNIDIIFRDETNTRLTVYYGNGDGTFSFGATISMTASPGSISIADFDGDGFEDFATANISNNTFSVFVQGTETSTETRAISIEDQEDAEDVLDILDSAIDEIHSLRATIGAQMNRLAIADSVAASTSRSLSLSYSQYSDLDIADEVSEMLRIQVLQSSVLSAFRFSQNQMKLILSLLE